MIRVPSQLDDGYTLNVHGCFVRQMLSVDREYVFSLIREGSVELANEFILAEPFVFGDLESLSEAQVQEVWTTVVENDTENQDFKNLISGAKMRMSNPRAADMSCDTCKEFVIDPDTWKIYERAGGFKILRGDGELLCETKSGCLRGHWSNPNGFTEKNTKVWNHYWEWKLAGMPLPECATQRRNWSTLNWITEHECSRQLCPTIRPTA